MFGPLEFSGCLDDEFRAMVTGRLILLWLCFLAGGTAATPTEFGRLPVRTFGLEQGLVSGFVSCLAQDREGVLWAGTEAGLHRFDGHRWHPMVLALPHPMVMSLHAARDGSLWISTRGGLVRLQAGRLEAVPGALPEGQYVDGEDARGRTWVHSLKKVFVEDAPGRVTPVAGWLSGDSLVQIAAARDAKEVIAITTRQLLRFEESRGAWVELPRDPLLAGIHFAGGAWDGDGGLWLLGSNRLFRRDRTEGWRELTLPGAGFTTAQYRPIQRDRDGWVWAGTSLGLYRFKGSELQFMAPPDYEQPMGCVDREGSPWFFGNGVLQVLGGGHWRISDRQDGLPRAAIWGVKRDDRGNLFATSYGGLAKNTGKRWALAQAGHFVDLVAAPDGALLAAGRPGGFISRIAGGRIERIPISGAEREVEVSLAVDATGRVFALAQGSNLFLGERHGTVWTWRVLPMPQGFDRRGFTSLVRTADFQVFLAGSNRLYEWSGAGWREVEGTLPHQPWIATKDREGRLVVGCLESRILTVHRRNPAGAFVKDSEIRVLESQPAMYLFALACDPEGRLWVGTNRGVYQVEASRILRLEGPGEGMPHPDVAYQGMHFEGSGVWVSTAGGIGYLAERNPVAQVPPQPVLLEARSGERVLLLGDIRLGRKERQFEAALVAPTYMHPQTLHLEGRWAGLGTSWRPLPAGMLSMPSLPPGEHPLEVRAVLPGVPPGPPLILKVRVAPNWHEGPLATGGLLLMVAGLGAGVVRWRQRRILTQNVRLRVEVAARTRELEQASAAKSAFLANMSHELRTPLNAVLLYGELLGEEARQKGDEGLGRDLARVHAAGRHLLALVNGILDIAKIEAGKMGLSRDSVLLLALAQEVGYTVMPQAEARSTVIRYDIPSELVIEADELKLRQVLINLAANAAKFTERGEICLRASEEGDRVRLEVADNGIGMAPEALERIFRPYEQAETRTDRIYGGTGLGLTLSLKLVELMGGGLAVQSEPGKGTTFTLDLPRMGPPASE